MKKITAFILLITLATAVNYNVLQNFISVDICPLGYSNSFFYVYPDVAYNVQTNQVTTGLFNIISPPRIILTYSLEPWVVTKYLGTYEFLKLSANATNILAKYPFTPQVNAVPYAQQSGNYIIGVLQDPKYFQVFIFDTIKNQFVCQNSLKYISGSFDAGWFDGERFIYALEKKSLLANEYIYITNCTENTTISVSLDSPADIDAIYGFSSSNNYLLWTSFFQQQTAIPFNFNEQGAIKFGPTSNFSYPYPINNQSFLANDFSHDGLLSFGVYQINDDLSINNSFYETTSINYSSTAAIPIYGSNLVYVSLGNGNFLYDISKNQITSNLGYLPPISLANGSSLNLTWLGYTIQSPGEPIFYNFWQSQTYYQVPSQPNLWVAFYAQENPPYCAALFINTNLSSIDEVIYTCSADMYGSATILDAGYDDEGFEYVAFLDEAYNLYILNQNDSYGPLDVSKQYLSPLITINMSNHTGILLSQGFNVIYFDFNGNILNSLTLSLGNPELIAKVKENIFVLATSGNEMNFFVYDAVANQVLKNISSNTNCNSMAIIGQYDSSSFNYILCSQLSSVAIIDNSGNFTTVSTSFQEITPSLYINNQNSFFVWDSLLGLNYGALVQIQ